MILGLSLYQIIILVAVVVPLVVAGVRWLNYQIRKKPVVEVGKPEAWVKLLSPPRSRLLIPCLFVGIRVGNREGRKPIRCRIDVAGGDKEWVGLRDRTQGALPNPEELDLRGGDKELVHLFRIPFTTDQVVQFSKNWCLTNKFEDFPILNPMVKDVEGVGKIGMETPPARYEERGGPGGWIGNKEEIEKEKVVTIKPRAEEGAKGEKVIKIDIPKMIQQGIDNLDTVTKTQLERELLGVKQELTEEDKKEIIRITEDTLSNLNKSF